MGMGMRMGIIASKGTWNNVQNKANLNRTMGYGLAREERETERECIQNSDLFQLSFAFEYKERGFEKALVAAECHQRQHIIEHIPQL